MVGSGLEEGTAAHALLTKTLSQLARIVPSATHFGTHYISGPTAAAANPLRRSIWASKTSARCTGGNLKRT